MLPQTRLGQHGWRLYYTRSARREWFSQDNQRSGGWRGRAANALGPGPQGLQTGQLEAKPCRRIPEVRANLVEDTALPSSWELVTARRLSHQLPAEGIITARPFDDKFGKIPF